MAVSDVDVRKALVGIGTPHPNRKSAALVNREEWVDEDSFMHGRDGCCGCGRLEGYDVIGHRGWRYCWDC